MPTAKEGIKKCCNSLLCGKCLLSSIARHRRAEYLQKVERRKRLKKILLATTAAACVGGVTSAEVSLSGEGKLGVSYAERGMDGAEAGVVSSANVMFTLSGTSDNEMIGGFGASFLLDADGSFSDDKLGNPLVAYVRSADGTLGNFEISSGLSAADKKSGGLGEPGLNGLDVDNIAETYYGGSGMILRYEKSIAGAAIARSVNLDDPWKIGFTIQSNTGLLNVPLSTTGPSREAAYGVGLGYKFTAHFAPIEYCVYGSEGSIARYLSGSCMNLICREVFGSPSDICRVVQPQEASQETASSKRDCGYPCNDSEIDVEVGFENLR